MDRYFLDIRDGDTLSRDELGTELASMQAVKDLARRLLADMARLNDGVSSLERFFIEIRSSDGPILRIRLAILEEEVDRL